MPSIALVGLSAPKLQKLSLNLIASPLISQCSGDMESKYQRLKFQIIREYVVEIKALI